MALVFAAVADANKVHVRVSDKVLLSRALARSLDRCRVAYESTTNTLTPPCNRSFCMMIIMTARGGIPCSNTAMLHMYHESISFG